MLTGPGRQATQVNLNALDSVNWQGTFTLPADAGLAGVESLSFSFSTVDDLGNVGSTIQGPNQFQVYQGTLPPLAVPTGLRAQPLSGGQVQLTWNSVAGAVAYQLFRQGPAEEALTPLGVPVGATSFTDATPRDGMYLYAVASVRDANGDQSVSAPSSPVPALADSVPPSAPQNLTLKLVPHGIFASWDPPPGGLAGNGEVMYSLYRATASVGQTIDTIGRTPIKSNIPPLQGPDLRGGEYLDASPSQSEHAYAVTAVDAAGNESAPSNTQYLDFGLLPVATLNVLKDGTQMPVLSWTHPSMDVDHYDVFLGDAAAQLLLQESPATSFTDNGYDGGERLYNVVAIDAGNAESLGRSLLLPVLDAQLPSGTQIFRGIFNQIQFQVSNGGASDVAGAHLSVGLHGRTSSSALFNVAAGQSVTVPVVVGGYDDLSASEELRTTIEIDPNPGESVQIVRKDTITVGSSALFLSVETDSAIRGGVGRVRFVLENTSGVETEVVTASHSGTQPSAEIRFLIVDSDNNVLVTQAFQQGIGPDVVSLSTGDTVARIAPGATFTSDWVDIPIPLAAPGLVRVEVFIDKFHYSIGTGEQVDITGQQGATQVSVVDTPYSGALLSISPTSSFGSQPIVIIGQAVDRTTGNLVANAALKVILSVRSFELTFPVVTDATGAFQLSYDPSQGVPGLYTVSVVHPDRTDRPAQGQFTINSILVNPTTFDVRIPKNYLAQLNVGVVAGDGTQAANVRIEYHAEDQPLSVLPTGITVQLPAAVDLTPNQSATLAVGFRADDSADATGAIVLRVMSDSTGATPIVTILVSYDLSEAMPALFSTPSLLETGTTYDTAVSENLTLDNRGTAPLTNVQMELLLQDASAPAPSWIYLTTPTQLGVLDVGASFQVELAADPPTTELEGYHQFILRVTGDNYPPFDIPIVVAVMQNGIGSVLFHASDIYTATLDANGQLIPGLASAQIKIQNADILGIEQAGTTDATGELLFSDLPAGSYLFRASASDHQDLAGRFQIKPGITTAQEAFLVNAVVTIEWSVRQISLEDRYEIVLSATFQANVPAPVVLIEPLSTVLPTLQQGDVFQGELSVTNYGLVRADNVRASFPSTDEFLRYEFLRDVPPSIEPHDRIVIPYRITAQRSFGPAASASGGGSCGYQSSANISYVGICANGSSISGDAPTYWVNSTSCGQQIPPPPQPIVVVSHGPSGAGGSLGGGVSGGGGPGLSWFCTPRGPCPADRAP